MHALVVTAHPSPRSLTAALTDVAHGALEDTGATVERSDLYGMGWDPAVRLSDYDGPADEGGVGAGRPRQGEVDTPGTVTLRSRVAYESGRLAPEIVVEQDKLRRAGLVVLLFPMWWHGMPAILKGWFDRVFVNGFAFGLTGTSGMPRKYGDGGLAGRRMLTVVTAGDRCSSFGPRGLNGDLAELLFPLLHGTAWYTGMTPLRPHLVAGVDRPGWDRFDEEAELLRRRIAGVRTEEPIGYRSLSDGDYGRDRLLRADVLPGESGLGVHDRRPVPAGVTRMTVDPNRG